MIVAQARLPRLQAANPTHVILALFLLGILVTSSCDELDPLPPPVAPNTDSLTVSDVQATIVHAVEIASRFSQNIHVAIADREGNTLGVFAMTGSSGSALVSLTKAQTAAFLSSDQNAFTTLTACYITRPHFPPGVSNTAGGPLFGVGFSSLPGSDIFPNRNALNDRPGGIPLYKNGHLVGGVGVSGGASSFNSTLCTGQSQDEAIALGAGIGLAVPLEKRGDNIFIDGIRFLYANASSPSGNFVFTVDSLTGRGTFLSAPVAAPARQFPFEGEVNPFTIQGNSILTQIEIRRIVNQARAQAARTRAAIRRPLGVAAQVFIAVVDSNGSVRGVYRTAEATLFSFDVAVQKARTALAFSNPNKTGFGDSIRIKLGLSPTQPFAVTTRAVGFLAQDFFPPGIDRSTLGHPVEPGPLFEGTDFQYQRRLLATPGLPPYGNGITIFPGGIPLYRNGVLVGAIGVSGDGVDQDDLIAFAGAVGFEPPPASRSDQFSYHGVRLPFVKFPRQAELGGP